MTESRVSLPRAVQVKDAANMNSGHDAHSGKIIAVIISPDDRKTVFLITESYTIDNTFNFGHK